VSSNKLSQRPEEYIITNQTGIRTVPLLLRLNVLGVERSIKLNLTGQGTGCRVYIVRSAYSDSIIVKRIICE